MDIRELRIGDKVEYLGRIVTIRAIYETGHVEFLMNNLDHLIEFTINCKDVESIPLTDELLKKIGFNSNNNGEYINTIGTVCLSIVKLSKCYYLVFVDYDMGNDLLDKPIKYLHQLQHELFDAGVELKIEL